MIQKVVDQQDHHQRKVHENNKMIVVHNDHPHRKVYSRIHSFVCFYENFILFYLADPPPTRQAPSAMPTDRDNADE